jgi:hypothetical protein
MWAALRVMIEIWPWTLSPLTSRVMAAMFALAGGVALGIAVELVVPGRDALRLGADRAGGDVCPEWRANCSGARSVSWSD